MLVGTVERLPTEFDAERAVEHLRMRVNKDNPQATFHSVTVGGLIERFMAEYVPKHCRKLAASVYRSLFDTHIKPKWADVLVEHVKTTAVEDWLAEYPASGQIKSHVRCLLHTMFQAALRWELVQSNPVDLVRQSRKRLKVPRVLTPDEFKALVGQLGEPHRTMVLVVGCLGLRVSEMLGLQWGDIDFLNLTVRIQRSVVEGEVNATKTEASASALPLDPVLREVLMAHRMRSSYRADSDFVFAGARGRPPWPDGLLTDHLKPAAVRAGVGAMGWHSLRHSYSTLLRSLGCDIKVQQALLRHADVATTINLYTQAVPDAMRVAASKAVETLWKN
jgi:integrase